MVVEEVIISVLLGEGCVKFDSNYQTITADIAFVILILLVFMKGYHLSRLDTTANTRLLEFKVPFMPWIPILALFVNVSLMLQLDRLTWYRFIVWLVIGTFCNFLRIARFQLTNLFLILFQNLLTFFQWRWLRWGERWEEVSCGLLKMKTGE